MNKQTSIQFSEQLIKGRVCEQIFSRMFQESGKFTVIPFGYENIVPEIMQYAKESKNYGLLENVRNAPDFAVILHPTSEVYLVEVKYRKNLNQKEMLEIAESIQDKWKQAMLFIATPDCFYFEKCKDIIWNEGVIKPLDSSWIENDIQKEYCELLNKFI
ncbi:MAG: hypothetical protein V4478_01170 [Patescibacteria group bacterium]